jgi:SMI1 / KNR4 family (SUKH-1)
MDTQLGADLLAALETKGWTVRRAAASSPLLPPPVQQRYPRVPAELTGFLEALESCVNAEENIWFLCPGDYRTEAAEGFRWNEFELMSLEATDDPAEQEKIRRFWDQHLPFMLAVHSDYDYIAVSLAEKTYGQIVHGCGDDFEDPSPVAASFAQFLALLKEEAAGVTDGHPLSYFV